MAFLIKNTRPTQTSSGKYQPVVEQVVVTERATASLPATATQTIFNVTGGRVLLKGLIGEVTTAIQAQACNLSVSVDSDAGASDVLASTLDINNDAVGQYYGVEGDGTALEDTGIGWARMTTGNGVAVGPGIITITTSATNTGSVKWTAYWQPLDQNAVVAAA